LLFQAFTQVDVFHHQALKVDGQRKGCDSR
jgi:hypothetical protein